MRPLLPKESTSSNEGKDIPAQRIVLTSRTEEKDLVCFALGSRANIVKLCPHDQLEPAVARFRLAPKEARLPPSIRAPVWASP